MRTGKIGLREFLHHRHVPDVTDSTCQCGRDRQTVKHILLACPEFSGLRRRIWKDDTGRRETRDVKEILNTPSKAKKQHAS
jgi:hypothetical protein